MSIPVQTAATGHPAFFSHTAEGRNIGPPIGLRDWLEAEPDVSVTIGFFEPAGWIATEIAAGTSPFVARDSWSETARITLDLSQQFRSRVRLIPVPRPSENVPLGLHLLAKLLLADDRTACDRLIRLMPQAELPDRDMALDQLARRVVAIEGATDATTGPEAVALALADQIGALESTLATTHRRACHILAERDGAQAAMEQILASTSWRATASLRWVVTILRSRR